MPLDIRSIILPYCLDLQECGRYAVLNRNYKPLGFISESFINYDEHPILLTLRITPSSAAKISFKGESTTSRIYLYDDGCTPTSCPDAWLRYCTRLTRLMALNLSGPEQRELDMSGLNVRRLNLIDGIK